MVKKNSKAWLQGEIARYKGLYEEARDSYQGSQNSKLQIMEESERRAKRASDAEQEVKWLRQLSQELNATIRSLGDAIRIRS